MAATKLTIIITENKVNHQDEAHILCNDMKSVLLTRKRLKNR